MRLPEIFLGVVEQIRKHGAVLHVVAIDEPVAASCKTIGREKGHAALRAAAIEGTAQIMFRVIGCKHDRVVNVGSLYGNPPEKVRVLRFQSLIMGLLWVLSICALRLLQGGRKPIIRLVVPLEPLVVPSSCKMRP